MGEKDAGERFFKGAQKYGFDFYSVHFFARRIGIIQALALGDFTVNLGQGLMHWQNLAFKKNADVINIKRQSAILRPYNSAGEFNFHRGAGITIKKGRVEATAFLSFRNISANQAVDTLYGDTYISSILMSGYHRSLNEIEDRNILSQTTFGGNLSYKNKRWYIGVNGVYYKLSQPLYKRELPYNKYAISGNSWNNLSVDYSYTYKNLHFFGEAATDKNMNMAFINGLMLNLNAKVDISLLHRKISPQYQSMYGNAFTENTLPTNESGFYAGINIRPTEAWRVEAYADFFSFPWLKYLVDAPSSGREYLVQITYSPSRQLEIYTRFRNEEKQANAPNNITAANYLLTRVKKNWRSQISYKINPSLTLRNRLEIVHFDRRELPASIGFLTNFDVIFKPMMSPISISLRGQYFETDDYDSRIYAYENDVLYGYSIPAFFDKGHRYYAVVRYDISKKISLWARWAQTLYSNRLSIGSGWDEIEGNKRSEVKLQARVVF